MTEDSEFLSGLTDAERETLKIMLAMGPRAMERVVRIADEDEKREWFFALIRKSAFWVASTVAAFVMFWEQVKSFIKGLWQ